MLNHETHAGIKGVLITSPAVAGSAATDDPGFYWAKRMIRQHAPGAMVAIHPDEIIVTDGIDSLRVAL